VFGHALRESSPWPADTIGLYANPHTVAEMKRTNRDKDWPFITALGVRMIEADDNRGWLHIFRPDTLEELLLTRTCPEEMMARRPSLELGVKRDARVAGAFQAERRLWEELDRRRIHILEQHLRPYVVAVRKQLAARRPTLAEEHDIRVECALKHLPFSPLKDYGLDKYIEESKSMLSRSELIPAVALTFLPDVMSYFDWLKQ
jgi:hypothetical protein